MVIWFVISKLDISIYRGRDKNYRKQYMLHMAVNQVSVLTYIICGISLLYSGSNGLYWMVPAMMLSFIKAVLDAWVLLVEIHR